VLTIPAPHSGPTVRVLSPSRLPADACPFREDVDLSHHTDRVSVQCAGTRAVSTGPEASLASAPLSDWKRGESALDDGELHHARVLLERIRFRDPRLPSVSESDAIDPDGLDAPPPSGASVAGSSYRLLVYVDDMHHALINLELDLRDLFEDGEAWDGRMTAGFTAGTGKASAAHTLTSWTMYEVSNPAQAAGKGESWNLRNLFSSGSSV
jgi:hypothetical protein